MKRLFLLITFLLSLTGFSQVANYTYVATTSTWAANATPTTIHSSAVDDALSSAINIGFTFVYNSVSYTQFKASTNGFLTFNTSNTSSQPTNNLNTSTERVILAALWDDNQTGASGNVNYKLTGTSPNRILTIEWRQLRWNKAGFSAGTIDCQIKLYETTNIIEFIYNRGSYQSFGNSSGIGASIGLGGATSGDFLSLSDIAVSPTKSTSVETSTIGTSPTNLTTKTAGQANASIPNGTKYRFFPPLVNNDCSGAIEMTVNNSTTCTSTTSGTTLGGTQSSTACSGTADDDVWYKFVATQSSHNLRETPGTIGDAVVQLYSGTCASLTSIACIDNYSVSDETYSATGLTIGNTYYVRVHSYGNGTGQGTFTMCVTSPCLGTPTSSAATSVTSTSFSANWSAVSGVGGYLLDVATNNTFTSMVSGYSALSVGNVTTYSVTGLSSSTTYYFRVRVNNSVCTNSSTQTVISSSPPPTISTSGTLTSFSSCSGTISSEKSFSITGYDLQANITVTAPTGFELSTTSGVSFSSPLTLVQSGGGVSATTIYVRMKSTATGSPSGNITCTSTSATSQNVAASGTVSSLTIGGTVSSNQNVNNGDSPNDISLTGNNGSVVKWVSSPDNLFTTTTDILITNTTLLSGNMGPITSTTYYRAVVKNGVCSQDNSSYVKMTIVNPLPIELIYFKGKKMDDGNLLEWESATETNNDYYTIYRSNYPIDWHDIVKIDGVGTSTFSHHYHYLDRDFLNDINYYYLTQTDFDGNTKKYEIISIDNRSIVAELVRVTNILGQDINFDTPGLKIFQYADGTIIKRY
jgi:hypothetical protein